LHAILGNNFAVQVFGEKESDFAFSDSRGAQYLDYRFHFDM